MTITDVVNCYAWSINDEKGDFYQAADEHVDTLIE